MEDWPATCTLYKTTLEAGKACRSSAVAVSVVHPLSANTLRSALDRVIHEQGRNNDAVAVQIHEVNDENEGADDGAASVGENTSEASIFALQGDEEGGHGGVSTLPQLCCQ